MKKRLLFVIAVFITWLPVFAIQKPVFMLYHSNLATDCTWIDWLKVVLHGLKLDCTMAGYLTVIPLLCTLVSVWMPGAYLRKILNVYFAVMATLVAAIFAVDVALYAFWGFRIDATVLFYMQSPADAMASVPLGLFIRQIFLFLVYAFGIYWIFRKLIVPILPEEPAGKRILHTCIFLLLGGILFLPIRGGVTTSTANVGMVYFSNKQFLNHAAINPVFSLIASLSKQQDFAAQFNFFPEDERQELFEQLIVPADSQLLPAEKASLLNTKQPDILLILLESFSANTIEALGGEPGVTPHLNRLSEEGILFTNLYSNSFRTDRGLVAILNGYPAQPTTSIMKYPAKSQTLPSISRSLVEKGYTADMLYGGDINFTNMQSYFFSAGYSSIVADRDFPLSSRLSKWGANDDITFAHLYKSLVSKEKKSPWLSTFLTLSSHEPFEVPYHRLEHPYLNSIAFTDSCLGDFIDKLKQTPTWENLLVILIADHGFRYPDQLKENEPLRFHIPMLWLGGAVKQAEKITTIGAQTDLAATLLSQLEIPHHEFTYSKNLLDEHTPRFAFYTFNNGFGFIDSSGISVFDNESNRPLIIEPETGNDLRLDKGKAFLQTLYDDLGNR
ncbi:phosphoglycerol transferase MdoB-like AlkP superfamily enzyme [Parabacteroides sp. PF5-5]|uniref:LTA synthase family protein n=1 Tax=unclassified Parabacteroides TaxID=2649774 RepID=UPI002477066D|nr:MULTISPECIES: alkaline phosphatase family protein [unclassified Parabacteroides]MDH6305423.1 phosphoglycerol transferase MdoB-like AlkP superfamily enzyme [Parabacteroides sp. PH5-39]MDH6316133.1 phosphoglycerol transferase MdoB-like AlkP superfamily enzyme [Parabacteroides sp. PF5-13]MDH6320283.1 phosphoglycerol transferase MdoB-like AlkP superfamily enzyme [Parabacteroides sp. PH5-13]MDH6324013.1 phosphoglycerol transferase MdoB-like AlkP superfamily enzyme [Parabacteroides sp. PH5-8]MDH6